jgi:hypothetical protein
MNRFEFTDASGDKLTVLPAKGGILIEAESAPHVPLDQVEVVVAGIRDMARQAAGRPAPCPCSCGYPNDPDTVHPTNGDPCYTTAPSVGEIAATRTLLSTPCDTCEHTLNWHDNTAGCTVPRCVCGRFQTATEGAGA